MVTPVKLTAEEQKLFVKLPRKLTKYLKVTREERTFEDSEEKCSERKKEVHFESPMLRDLQSKLKNVQTIEEVEAVTRSMEMPELSRHDEAELFYIMGPAAIGDLICNILHSARTKRDMSQVAHLAKVRDVFLNALPSLA